MRPTPFADNARTVENAPRQIALGAQKQLKEGREATKWLQATIEPLILAPLLSRAFGTFNWRKFTLRHWFPIVVLLALLTLGAPSVANAHGGRIDGDTVTVAVHSQDQSTPKRHDLVAPEYFEIGGALPAERNCTGACCCQGMSHCSSQCGSPSAALHKIPQLSANVPVRWIGLAYDSSVKVLDRKFGLERPPRG